MPNSFLIVANWKMNGSRSLAAELLASLKLKHHTWPKLKLLICPPNLYLETAHNTLHGTSLSVGAQDLWFGSAPATGNTSADMLKDIGANFVIIGHSERRQLNLESDLVITSKLNAAIEHDLVPILCVG